MSDIVLSRAEAKNLADFLRRRGIGEHHSLLKRLDPPQPSLRDEVAAYLADHSGYNSTSLMDRDAAEDILALVRERIAALPCCECKGRGQSSRHGVTDLVPCWVCDAGRATLPPISRRDILALLGSES